jgi:hypothetical protein
MKAPSSSNIQVTVISESDGFRLEILCDKSYSFSAEFVAFGVAGHQLGGVVSGTCAAPKTQSFTALPFPLLRAALTKVAFSCRRNPLKSGDVGIFSARDSYLPDLELPSGLKRESPLQGRIRLLTSSGRSRSRQDRGQYGAYGVYGAYGQYGMYGQAKAKNGEPSKQKRQSITKKGKKSKSLTRRAVKQIKRTRAPRNAKKKR